MTGTIREQVSDTREQTVRLVYRVFNCDRLLDEPLPPWAWHANTLSIGRGERNLLAGDKLTLEDGRVSGSHAKLEIRAGTPWLSDVGSSNGTFLNGEPVTQPVPLQPGDLIEVGRTLLTWREAKASVAAQLVVPGGVRFGLVQTFSPSFAEVLAIAARAAHTAEPVLMIGETGTGKDVLAHALHDKSGRKGPFVAVDSGAIPESLFESTLFGHEKGAFTGATEQRTGDIVRAHKGTLFLDEVGNLPPSSQARLLRVLETRFVTPLGAREGQNVDVRVVAATNRTVLDQQDGFREDLVHRLAGFVLNPPALRERKEDLGVLVKVLLEDAGVKSASVTPNIGRTLFLEPLRGNVRQLRNLLRRASVGHGTVHIEQVHGLTSDDATGDKDAHRPKRGELKTESGVPAAAVPARPRGWRPTKEELEALLKKNGGSVAAAARELDTYPRQLYRWLEELGLQPDDYRNG